MDGIKSTDVYMWLFSVSQRRSMHINTTSTRRRSEPLRDGVRAVESDPERGEDPDQRDVDVGGAERRVAGERGGGEDVEGEAEGV